MSTNPQRSPEPHPPHGSASPPIPARSSVARSVLNATKRRLPENQRRRLASKARSKHPVRPQSPVPSREWSHVSEAKSMLGRDSQRALLARGRQSRYKPLNENITRSIRRPRPNKSGARNACFHGG